MRIHQHTFPTHIQGHRLTGREQGQRQRTQGQKEVRGEGGEGGEVIWFLTSNFGDRLPDLPFTLVRGRPRFGG
jgi:hypothetical protein